MTHIREVEREAKYFEFNDYCICKECAENMPEEEGSDITQETVNLNPNMFPQGLYCDHCNAQILEPIEDLNNRVEENTTY